MDVCRVRLDPGEHEVVVRDRGLPRIDLVSAGDLVEGVDGEGRGAVGGGKEIRVDLKGRARLHLGVLVDPMGPDDLLRGRELLRDLLLGPRDPGWAGDGASELAPAHGENASGPPDFVFFGRERHGRVRLSLGEIR
jgi:hypothetical protein